MKNYSRRDFIKLSSSALALTALGGIACTAKGSAGKSVPIGVQLYSVRHELDEDFEGTLQALAEMGFDGVEFASYHGHSASEIRAILDDYGLESHGTHIMFDIFSDDQFKNTIDFHQTLGNQDFIIRWIPEEDWNTRDAFLRTIDEYNKIVDRLEPYGMRLGYHNHGYIFDKFDDKTMWDILAENTDERFLLQFDTANAAIVGIDPEEVIRRHPGRTPSMHVKAYSTENEAAVVGDDDLDWPGIIESAEEVGGIEKYILEYEIEGVSPLEALEATKNNFGEIRADVISGY